VKRNRWRIVWLAVGLALLAYVVWRAGPATTAEAFLAAFQRPWLLAGGLGLFVATQAGFLLKWHLTSRIAGAPVGARQSLRLFGTVYLVGTFTPGRAGEVVVPLLMRGGGKLAGVALVNRVLESLWTAFAGLVALWFIFGRGDDPRGRYMWVLLGVVAAFVAVAVVLSRRRLTAGMLHLVRACLAPFRRWRPVAWLLALEERYAEGIEHFYDANERVLRPGPVLLFSILLIAIWVMMILANWLLIGAVVPESGVTFAAVFAVMVVSAAMMFLSPIPSGVGLSEFTAVALFAFLGYPQPQFVSFLLLARIILYTVVVAFYLVGQLAGRPLPAPPEN
jgi:uncharacterized protein (TIRG00374 family)